MNLDVVELFAGVGGFRVGLNNITDFKKEDGRAIEKNGWNFVWANQYEPSTKAQHAFECYSKRFQIGECSNEDINKVDKKTIPNHSLLVGGFPCQDYSVARSISGEKGIAGKKGVLFWDIRDTLVEKNTPFVLLENVDRLLKSPASIRGRDFAIMLKTFDELGYYVQWRVINAGDYGMPQKRRRVFIFASKKNTKYSDMLSKKIDLESSIFEQSFPTDNDSDILKEVDINKYKDTVDVTNNYKDGKFLDFGMMLDGRVFHKSVIPKKEKAYTLEKLLKKAQKYNDKDLSKYFAEEEKLDKWKYLKGSKRIERQSKSGHKYIYSEGAMSFPENIKEPARTMLTSEGTVNRSSHIIFDEINQKYRILTEVECEMIQMFPPNWTDTMPARRRYFMMGNALVTGIVSRLEPYLKQIIENE